MAAPTNSVSLAEKFGRFAEHVPAAANERRAEQAAPKPRAARPARSARRNDALDYLRRHDQQRLTRAVGKAVAIDVILSGRFLTATEALRAGLVARVVAKEAWLDEAKRVARDIAAKGPVATRLAKEAVDRAFEGPLTLGVEYERRLLYLALASEDAKEGLTAFLEKRRPNFKGR